MAERSRHELEFELVDAMARRDAAASNLDLDAYRHLAQQVDDLCLGIAALIPSQRDGD